MQEDMGDESAMSTWRSSKRCLLVRMMDLRKVLVRGKAMLGWTKATRRSCDLQNVLIEIAFCYMTM
jgi:hypothetical protein